jgi:peptide/nickel transport system permease protein
VKTAALDPLLREILLRAGAGVLTLLAASALIFLGVSALPGDAATAALGQEATPGRVAELRKELGLDRPVQERYVRWLWGFVRGDLGHSLPTGVPVTSVIGDKVRNTAVLGAVTMVLFVPLAVALGALSARRPGRATDQSIATITLAFIATPEFVVGSILVVVLAVWLRWLPAVSLIDPSRPILARPSILVLPVVTLLAATVAQSTRMIRATMIEVMGSPYVEAARLNGVREWRLLLWHALPNTIAPTIQILAYNVPWLVGGIVIVESVFEYRGVGSSLVNAVQNRDLPTAQVLAMLIAAVIVATNMTADLAVICLNPRLRRRH